MTREIVEAAAECMKDMEREAKVWTLTKVISGYLEDNEVTYDEMCDVFTNIMHYNHHVAEIESYWDGEDIDIDDEDGDTFFVRGI